MVRRTRGCAPQPHIPLTDVQREYLRILGVLIAMGENMTPRVLVWNELDLTWDEKLVKVQAILEKRRNLESGE